jgi:hypothetical protein
VRAIGAAAAIALACALSPRAEATQLSRAQRARVELHRRAAERAGAEGDFATAASQLEEALRIAGEDPALLLELARVHGEQGGQCAAAFAELDRFFNACEACELAERGRAERAVLGKRCASEVTIETSPAGAIVQISGEDFARAAPFTTSLAPGAYTIEARRHGHFPRRMELLVQPATSLNVPVALELDPVLTARPRTSLGPQVATTPAVAPETPPPILEYVALGVGLAGGIAGAVFTQNALARTDEALEQRHLDAPEEEVQALDDAARTQKTLAYVGFGVSIAGFASAVVLDLIDTPD